VKRREKEYSPNAEEEHRVEQRLDFEEAGIHRRSHERNIKRDVAIGGDRVPVQRDVLQASVHPMDSSRRL
jgi:hypothetical protein